MVIHVNVTTPYCSPSQNDYVDLLMELLVFVFRAFHLIMALMSHILIKIPLCHFYCDTQQALYIEQMFLQCWASVVDGGPTLQQNLLNVSCLLGINREP